MTSGKINKITPTRAQLIRAMQGRDTAAGRRAIAEGPDRISFEPGFRQDAHGNCTATEAARIAATAPPRRVTPAAVDAEITDEDYLSNHQLSGGRVTFCILTLSNGFTVTGESACADPAAYDEDIGRDLAKGRAREKVFELLAFRLRDELHRERLHQAAQRELAAGLSADDAVIKAVMQRVAK